MKAQIIAALEQVQAGRTVDDVARECGVSQATIYTWKAKFGGMDASEAQRLSSLEEENSRLKRMVADLSLDKEMLKTFPDVSFELLSKAVLSLLDRDGAGHPEGASKLSVAVLGQLGGAAELARLLSGQIETTELQELAVMPKAAQIASFGQDG